MSAGHEDTRSRLARFKILEAHDAITEALEFLNRMTEGGVTVGEILDFVMVYLPTSSTKSQIIETLIQARNDGGHVGPEDLKFLEMTIRMQIPQKFEALDNLTTLAATRLPKKDEGYESYYLYHPDLLVSNFNPDGSAGFGVVSGTLGTGKTNIGCLLLEKWDEKGDLLSIGNIMMRRKPPIRYAYCSRISQVLKATAEATLAGRPWLFVDDKAGLTWMKAEAMRKRNRQQDKLARIVRKLGGNMVLVEQRYDSVPTIIQEFQTNRYHATSKKRVVMTLEGPKVRLTRKLKDLPLSKLPYDSNAIAWLAFDVDIEALFEFITDTEGGSQEQARRIGKYLVGEREDEVSLQQAACVQVCKGGMTQTVSAKNLGVGQATISRWLGKGHEHVFS